MFIAFPLLWAINTAFKPMSDVFRFPPVWISSNYTLEPMTWLLTSPEVYNSFLDSLIVTTGNTVLTVAFATFAGYGFSRFRQRTHGDKMVFLLLAMSMIPGVTLVLPFFFIWAHFGLLDTYLVLIIVYLSFNLPFATWLMRDYFDKIPTSYEQAARVDGYSRIQTLRKVVLPLVMPGIFAVTVLSWLFAWTNFLYAFILAGDKVLTYTALYPNFVAGRQVLWNRRMSMALIALVPPIVMMIMLRKRVTELF
jgi:ABC-type glycerol-3-phosphate transport system permease component